MSCYKCGKELPGGEVECPDGCDAERQLMFALELRLSQQKITADRSGFEIARDQFCRMLGEIIIGSGLSNYCEAEKP